MLLVTQIALCAVLVTSSMVAVRGLLRSLQGNLGFEPRNAMLVGTSLMMAGYGGDAFPVMQKRMIDALETVPGVKAVGLVDRPQLYYGANSTNVFTGKTRDLRPATAAAESMLYNISPEYFDAARTTLLAGRVLSWHDDKNAPRVSLVNRKFANRIFGSVTSAVGGYYKRLEGTRIQVVGVVENGKYGSLTEDLQPAIYLPFMQQTPINETMLVVRSQSRSGATGCGIKK